MSLFLTMGAMAQDPVLELNANQIGTTYPKQLSDDDAAKVFALDDLTVVVRINTNSVSGRMSLFATSDPTKAANTGAEGKNSRYVGYGMNGADVGYLASWKTGDRFTGKKTDNSGICANATDMIVAYVISPSSKTFKAYVNGEEELSKVDAHADGFMSGYEIATPKMVKADHENACIYIGGAKNSSGNGEVFNGTITGVKVYSGALTDEQILALSTTFDALTSYEQFESGKVYTFESQRGWLMAKSGTDFVYNSTKITDANPNNGNAYCQWVLYSTDKGDYLYNVGVGKFISVNKSNANSIPLSAVPTTGAVDFKASSLPAYPIILGVEEYAVNHNTSNSAFTYGALLWKDGWTSNLDDEGSCHKVTLIGDADETVLETIAGAVATYENMPVAGKYYTFKNDSYYITSSVTSGGRIAMSATMDATSVYYYDGSHLLAYTTGLYFGLNGTDWTFETIGSNDISAIEFVAAANGTLARYNIKSGGRWLHRSVDNGVSYINRCQNNTCGDAHNWTIEEVTELPVAITAAKYATFFAPVAVEVAEGVTAYTVAINGEWATLKEIESGVIPANTGVVLYSETAGTYNFAITDDVEAIEGNTLRGSAAATYYTEAGTYYALGQVDGVVAFYKDEFKNNRFQNNSHKAYLYVANASETASYSFRFGEGTTAIENVEVENEVKVIYDLTGRRVEAITAPGIYIVGGKKVLVK